MRTHAVIFTILIYIFITYASPASTSSGMIFTLIQTICSAHISTLLMGAGCWVLKARIQKHWGKPLLFHDKCPGLFYVHYTRDLQALRPIRRTKQLWLSVLLKDTSAATGQAGIRTHILTTPELASNALDRSATTLLYDTHLLTIKITNPYTSSINEHYL